MPGLSKKMLIGAATAVTLGIIGYNSLFWVGPGYSAIIFNKSKGVDKEVYSEGLHFKIPFVATPIYFDINPKEEVVNIQITTKDLKKVEISIKVVCRPQVSMLPRIFSTLGLEYAKLVVPSVTAENAKLILSQFTATQILNRKEDLIGIIQQQVISHAGRYYLIIDEVSLINLSFQE